MKISECCNRNVITMDGELLTETLYNLTGILEQQRENEREQRP
jgi:hypothetical protein